MTEGRLFTNPDSSPWINPSRSIREVLSWRIATGLIRRHPDRLRLIETHPGGGMYDCLSLYDRRNDTGTGALHLNRVGSATLMSRLDGRPLPETDLQWPSLWAEAVALGRLRPVVEELARMTGLPAVSKLPHTSPQALTYRVITELLAAGAFSSTTLECRMGLVDTTGPVDPSIRTELFDAFESLKERLAAQREDDFLGVPAYRFWFLLRDGEPLVGFEASSAVAETISGEVVDMSEAYQAERRIWPLAWRVGAAWLP